MRHFARFTLRAFLASLFFLTLSLTPSVQAASTRLVSTTGSDSGACTGSPCATIAYAITQATSGDTINVAAGTYTEAGINIVDKNLTITGAGAASTIVQAAASAGIATDRVFRLNDAVTPFDMTGTIEAMTIRYGVSGSGGGVNNSAALTLNDVVISDNQTNSLNGGGISSNAGSVTLNNSTVSNNQSADKGGGIFVSVANLTLNNSTVSGNTAVGDGGGVFTNSGTTSLNYSTVANNTSDSDSSGAGDGGGVYRNSGAINLKSSIVAGNKKAASTTNAAADCSGTITSQGYNLTVSSTGCSLSGTGDVTVTPSTVFTAVLGSLANNGGQTYTHALIVGGAAIDVIPNGTNSCGSGSFAADQRGGTRPYNSNCDMGAYELKTVRSVATTGADSGDCSLTDCLTLTYAYSKSQAGDTINVAAGTYTTSTEITIDHTITITGAGASSTIVQAAASAGTADHRVFKDNGVTATLEDMTIRYGVETSGGAINNANGTLTLNNVTISDNQVKDVSGTGLNGGAISINGGTLTINNSTISNNSVTTTDSLTSRGNGGGIFIGSAGTVNLNNSTVSGNSAKRSGGGLYTNGGTINVNYSTIANNTSDNDDDAVGDGGVTRSSGTIKLKSSIVAGNKKGVSSPTDSDCSGTITSQGYNLTGNSTGCSLSGTGDVTVTPSTVFTTVMDSLADNGGSTYTHALMVASPARDVIPSGTNTCGTSPFDEDQRGMPRPLYGFCDMGAYEYQDATLPTVNSFTATSLSSSLNIPITAFTASDAVGVTGYLISESSTPPAAGAAGWTGSAPSTYTVASVGSYTLYPWAKDAAGNVSSVYGSPAAVSVCASAITVTSNADSGAGTLRQAIADACAGGTINFNASLSGGTIHLASTLTLSKDVTIDGSALTSKITISGDTDNDTVGDVRVFYVNNLVTVALDSLIVTKGQASGAGVNGEGGAILNHGWLTITDSTFSNNSASGPGGAIVAYRTVTIIDSTFSGNSSSDSLSGGGAIYNAYTVTIKSSLFSGNSADANGGGGGAIINTAPATIANSTFIGNSAAIGGAILTTNALTIMNSTIAGNTASYLTGGLDIEGNTTNLSNMIIADNFVTASGNNEDCLLQVGANIGTNTNNLIEDGTCSPALSGAPSLGALADNGGATQTLALLAGSTAIDAGDDATCAASPVDNLDQRGTTRPNGAHCDIGAYEYVDTTAPAVTAFTATSPSNLNVPITIFTASDDATLAGYLITESSTPPSAGAAGWTASAPTTYIVASDGSYALYPWAKDAVGHVSAVYGSPASVTVETTAPSVVSSACANADPTNAAGVDFIVTFSEAVSGVDTSDFSLVMAAGLTGASVTGVSGGPTVYTVSVNTGSGSGTLRLDLHDDDTIADSAGNQLGGSGLANGNFVTGEFYTIDKTAPTAGSLVAPNVTSGGGTTYSFTVSFSDNLAIDSTSIDGSDIRVTGPGGFDQRATLVSVTPAGNGTPRTATYQITAPGGAWDSLDRGTYTVAVEANQIFDSVGNPVGAASLGSFLVSLNYTAYLPLVLR
jgi:hypothetical protein